MKEIDKLFTIIKEKYNDYLISCNFQIFYDEG